MRAKRTAKLGHPRRETVDVRVRPSARRFQPTISDVAAPPPTSSCAAAKNLHTRLSRAAKRARTRERAMSLQTVPSDAAEHRPNRPEDAQALEADARLRDDIRL